MARRGSLAASLCNRLIRLAAALVPTPQRDTFRREWEAELAYAFDPEPPRRAPGAGGRLRLVYRAAGALADALLLRAREFTVDSIVRDLRLAVRSFTRRPAFAALALVTIALGIGANTAIFTVVDAVLLRPLPYPDPDRLVAVYEQDQERGWDRVPASAEDFLSWREEARAFDALTAGQGSSYALTDGEGAPEQVPGMAVTADFFRVFGVEPAIGRPFTDEANEPGAAPRVVLSHGLWVRRYGSDPALVGRTIRIGGEPVEVAAVMPEGFQFPSQAQLWTPLQFSQAQLDDRNWHFLTIIGRLGGEVSVEGARAEMRALAARLAEAWPESNTGWGADVRPLHGEMTQSVSGMLWVLLGAVGFVLLIACANVANLLLVRAAGRTREMSLRAALGAGKTRLVRQLLTESVVLSLGGAILGVLLAGWALDALLAMGPLTVPGGGDISIDLPVLGVTALAALVTGLVFGAAPAVALWRSDLQTSLREGGRSRTAAGGHRLRSLLVVSELALALVLVTGAGLMLQTVQGLLAVDVGVGVENRLVAQFSLPVASYPGPEEQVRFYDELLESVEAIPGVEAAGLNPWVPPTGGPQIHVRIEGVHDAWTMDLPVARLRPVSAGYFELMEIDLLRGRVLTGDDRAGAPRAVVVDQAFVDVHYPGQDPLGQFIRTLDDEPREIVGVVANVANAGLGNASQPSVYLPVRQSMFGNGQTLIVKTAGDPTGAIRAVREVVNRLDPDLPLTGLSTLEDRVAASVSQPRFNALLLGLFAVLALVLAAVGIYGVMAFTVSERTPEIGLRMALGASAASVRGMVVRRAVVLAGAGVGLGVLSSIGLTRLMESLLFGVEPGDPRTLAAVSALLFGVALVASYLPARRASRLDPVGALREE
ncbi:ABC transporter permease [Gaopeijia maritima]|uniref:ABC transporter permease n=1 Tax=Gaopeijia maritima TaxID=3119007 RepID=UPI003247F568